MFCVLWLNMLSFLIGVVASKYITRIKCSKLLSLYQKMKANLIQCFKA